MTHQLLVAAFPAGFILAIASAAFFFSATVILPSFLVATLPSAFGVRAFLVTFLGAAAFFADAVFNCFSNELTWVFSFFSSSDNFFVSFIVGIFKPSMTSLIRAFTTLS